MQVLCGPRLKSRAPVLPASWNSNSLENRDDKVSGGRHYFSSVRVNRISSLLRFSSFSRAV